MCDSHANRENPSSPAGAADARLRFWQIENSFKCPVVGLCLTSAEQKRLLKKSGMTVNDKNPFEIHERLVGSAETNNRLSRKVDQLLTRKFARPAATLRALPEEAFMDHWKSCFESGQIAAVFWTAASRTDLSAASKREIFGVVHMAMHAGAAQQVDLKRRIHRLQEESASRQEKLQGLKQGHRSLQRENRALKEEQVLLAAKLACETREKEELNAAMLSRPRMMELEARCRQMEAELREKAGQIQSLKQENTRLCHRCESLSEELDRFKFAREHWKNEMRAGLCSMMESHPCDDHCPAFGLCRKRVLIVGGIARMESLYRKLIEDEGGRLEYHDGSVKGGSRKLEGSLKRADIVLCPVNCNSHAACALVKRLGKKHKKPVHMMANFSLSAVSQMLGAGDSARPPANPVAS